MKLDPMKAFPSKGHAPSTHTPRTYDVRVTINKAGEGRPYVIRFGFINKAAKIFGEFPFIEASDIEYTKNRVYFRSQSEKTDGNVHTLSFNKKTRQDGCYFIISPGEKGEKIYRMSWVGKTFPILYDEENDLYYIETAKEEN